MVGSLGRLYGDEVVAQIGADYCAASDLGGNAEVGLTRDEGVSFNPRIARIVSLMIQDCESVVPHMLRVAVYSAISSEVETQEAVPSEVRPDVAAVRAASDQSPSWIQGVALALFLDRTRHLHMINMSDVEKMSYMAELQASPMLSPQSGAPANLRLKVIHAIDVQNRRLKIDAEK